VREWHRHQYSDASGHDALILEEPMLSEGGLRLDEAVDDGVPVLSVSGEIDMATAPAFKMAVTRLAGLHDRLVLDLGGVSFMDSAGIGVIGSAASLLGNGVRIRNASSQVANLLRVTGMDKFVTTD